MSGRTLREAALGLVYLLVVAALVLLSILVYQKRFTSTVDVSLRVGTSGNALQDGSDVKARGIVVGTVSDIRSLGARGAELHLALDPGRAAQLPPDVTGQLLPKTLFGEQYVSLTIPAHPTRGHLRDGQHIAQDTSPAAIELQQLFDDLFPVLRAVRPQDLAATLGEIAGALRGAVPRDLAGLIDTLGPYLARLRPYVPQIATDLDRLSTVAATYTDAAPQILDALNDFTVTSRTIVRERVAFESSLRSLTSMANTVGGFVGTSQDQIIGLSRDSLPTLRTLARYSGEFPCLTRSLAAFAPVAAQAFGAGSGRPGARVILHVVPVVRPYTAADAPRFDSTGGVPRCPYAAATQLANTALAAVPGTAGTHSGDPKAVPATGIGTANSPQENRLIAELIAPTLGVTPAQVPDWSSLLLGPALRGTQVSLR